MTRYIPILSAFILCASCLPTNIYNNNQFDHQRNSSSYEKPNHEFATEEEKKSVELLFMERKYTEADQRNKEIFKDLITEGGQLDVYECYFLTGLWMRKTDNITLMLEKVNANIQTYEAEALNKITESQSFSDVCSSTDLSNINSGIPSRLPFTIEFIDFINKYRENAFNLCRDTNKRLSNIRQAQRELRLNKQNAENELKKEQIRIKNEEERLAREHIQLELERKELELKESIEKENTKMKTLAKKAGYSGYFNGDIVGFIHTTQTKGGLENHINQVIGCNIVEESQCEYYYQRLKAIQILDKGVLYSYSAYYGDDYLDFVVYVDKEKGKMYQEGQSCSSALYSFKGMYSYISVAGSRKTVPHFAKVRLSK